MNLLERAKKSQKIIEQVHKLYNELVPQHRQMSEIAKVVGVSKSRVYQILNPNKKQKKK